MTLRRRLADRLPGLDGLAARWRRRRFRGLDISETFRRIHRDNYWQGRTTVSGPGSEAAQTAALRTSLPALLRELGVRRLLDLGCGDVAWLDGLELGLDEYVGADVVEDVLSANLARGRGPAGCGRRFVRLESTADPLPPADLVLVRDCWVHLSDADLHRALDNLKRAPIDYLLATTFPGRGAGRDIVTGDWRPLDLEAPPFSLPPPRRVLREGSTEANGRWADKSLALWRVADLR